MPESEFESKEHHKAERGGEEHADLDAEHEPQLARNASKADLKRYWNKEAKWQDKRRAQEVKHQDSSLDALKAAFQLTIRRVSKAIVSIGDRIRADDRTGWRAEYAHGEELQREIWDLTLALRGTLAPNRDELLPLVRHLHNAYLQYEDRWKDAKNQFPSEWGLAGQLVVLDAIQGMYGSCGQEMDASQLETLPHFPEKSMEAFERDAAKSNLTAARDTVRLMQMEQMSRERHDTLRLQVRALHSTIIHSANPTSFGELLPDTVTLNAEVAALLGHVAEDRTLTRLLTTCVQFIGEIVSSIVGGRSARGAAS